MEQENNSRPPREDLVRAMPGSFKLRSAGNGKPPILSGHFAVFNEWIEVDSLIEGHFMERFAPGAFAKTIKESRDRLKVLFDHGEDPHIGKKVLGPIAVLREDEQGPYYEVPLLDTSYVRDLLPGLQEGLYGSSVRFGIVHERFETRPQRSELNPDGIPERTVLEARVLEFGPVTFNAYRGADAHARSLTDDLILRKMAGDPQRLRQLAERSGLELPTPERGDDRLYRRCAEYIGNTVWEMHPAALETIMQIVQERRNGHKPSKEEIQERIGARDDAPVPTSEPHVAVIPIQGSIVPKADMFSEMSGATSIESLQADFRGALADPSIAAIVFNIDSPGGSSALVPEMTSEIFNARGVKPIVAVANTFMASAAYHIAVAADEIIVTPSGSVGSIGVWSAHDDLSAAQEKLGVKTTLVSAGKYKVEGNPFEPLGEEAKTEMQRSVDTVYKRFVDAVAKGRNVTVKEVRTGFGEGRMVKAEEAVLKGMADRVATIDETLARVANETRPAVSEPEPSGATTPSPQSTEAAAGTSGNGQGEPVKKTWPKVTDEEWDALWSPET